MSGYEVTMRDTYGVVTCKVLLGRRGQGTSGEAMGTGSLLDWRWSNPRRGSIHAGLGPSISLLGYTHSRLPSAPLQKRLLRRVPPTMPTARQPE